MFLGGQAAGYGPTDIFSASLPPHAPLSSRGWTPDRNTAGELVPVAGRSRSRTWDGDGGRHCTSYVKGWDPAEGKWVERIYYAGAANNLWGPYTIGFLQWDGDEWRDQPEPVFVATEEWEHGSVYEPNLVYHDGKWKMWYVAGSNQEDYLIHGYSESEDGCTGWSKHAIFRASRNEAVRFLCSPEGIRIGRGLRARLDGTRHAAGGNRIVVVYGGTTVQRAFRLESADSDHDR